MRFGRERGIGEEVMGLTRGETLGSFKGRGRTEKLMGLRRGSEGASS